MFQIFSYLIIRDESDQRSIEFGRWWANMKTIDIVLWGCFEKYYLYLNYLLFHTNYSTKIELKYTLIYTLYIWYFNIYIEFLHLHWIEILKIILKKFINLSACIYRVNNSQFSTLRLLNRSKFLCTFILWEQQESKFFHLSKTTAKAAA